MGWGDEQWKSSVLAETTMKDLWVPRTTDKDGYSGLCM